jgi:hypothetical protein
MPSAPCGKPVLPAIAVLLLSTAGLSGQSKTPPPGPWPGWDRYQKILWSTGDPISPGPWLQRVREAGFTAEQCAANEDCRRFAAAGLSLYAENLVSELGFHHGRAPLYEADWQDYTTTEGKRFLVRKPCLDDPAFWEQIAPRTTLRVRNQMPNRPLLYDLRDEPSLASFVSPMDYCFCPHTLRAMRNWLNRQYSSLAALNREWDTSFTGWNEVTPSTTFEIKRREKAALAAGKPENYASWADHRAFMDDSFAQAIERLRELVHREDPRTPVGIAGVQMPSAWGGYDLWRLSRAVDWMEPYDIANSRAILASFLPAGSPVLTTYFGSDIPALTRQAWLRVLDGDRGAIVWDDEKDRVIQKSAAGMPLTRRGADLRGLFEQVGAAAQRLAGARRLRDGIAIHYSQASIRAHWMFDSREDGNTWFRRLASYEREHSRFAKVRNSFVKVVEDLGLGADFVSYEQIEHDELIRGGYKILILPQSVALSALECRRISAFVQAGGTVIADNMIATMDEHCRRLPAGQLDELFGIRQKPVWKAAGERGFSIFRRPGPVTPIPFDPALALAGGHRGSIPGAPMAIENRVGKGRAIYLNLDMHDYADWRNTWPDGAAYRAVFDGLFRSAGLAGPVQVQGAPGVLVRRFAGAGLEYMALAQNTGSKVPTSTVRVHVQLAQPMRVKAEARDFGVVREFDLALNPSQPVTLLELRNPQ